MLIATSPFSFFGAVTRFDPTLFESYWFTKSMTV